MEDYLEIIGWLIVVFFFLLGGRRNKKKGRARPAGGATDTGPQSLEEALREIREALGETDGSRKPKETVETRPAAPDAVPRRPPVPERSEVPRSRSTVVKRPPRPAAPTKKRIPEFVSPVETGRSKVSETERRFTSKPTFLGEGFIDLERAEVSSAGHPHRGGLLASSRQTVHPKEDSEATVRAREVRQVDLNDLRRAVVLSEVLGPPRALRPFNRSRGPF